MRQEKQGLSCSAESEKGRVQLRKQGAMALKDRYRKAIHMI